MFPEALASALIDAARSDIVDNEMIVIGDHTQIEIALQNPEPDCAIIACRASTTVLTMRLLENFCQDSNFINSLILLVSVERFEPPTH